MKGQSSATTRSRRDSAIAEVRCLTALLLLPDNPPAAERARAREAEVARDVPRAKERRGPPRRQLPATEKALDVADAQDSRKVSKPGMVIIAEPNPITPDVLFDILLGQRFIVTDRGHEAVDDFRLEITVAAG
jgi:hypothetical protein